MKLKNPLFYVRFIEMYSKIIYLITNHVHRYVKQWIHGDELIKNRNLWPMYDTLIDPHKYALDCMYITIMYVNIFYDREW